MRDFWEVLDFAWGEPAEGDHDLGDDGADGDDADGMDGGDGDSSSPGSPPDGNHQAVGDEYPLADGAVDSQVADEVEVIDSQGVSCAKTTMDSDEGPTPDSIAAASTDAPNDMATHEVSSKPCAAEASPANTANCTGKPDKSPKFGIESQPRRFNLDRANAIRHRVSNSIIPMPVSTI